RHSQAALLTGKQHTGCEQIVVAEDRGDVRTACHQPMQAVGGSVHLHGGSNQFGRDLTACGRCKPGQAFTSPGLVSTDKGERTVSSLQQMGCCSSPSGSV